MDQQFMKQLEELRTLFADNADKEEKNEEAAAFSPFGKGYIKLDEKMSSRILADLLDPGGEHGQGDFFLKGFSKLCKLKEERVDLANIRLIKREAPTRQGRFVDIVIRSERGILGVESKISAQDLHMQVSDYLAFLHSEAKDSDCDYRLLYLTPHGRPPSPYSLPDNDVNKGRCICRNWHEVLAWLLKCCAKQRMPEKLKFFLRDFITAMHGEGIYMKNTHREQNIMNAIRESCLETARECHRLYPEIVVEDIKHWRDETYAKIFLQDNELKNFELKPINSTDETIAVKDRRPICVKLPELPTLKAGIMFEEPMGKNPGVFVELTGYPKQTVENNTPKIREYLIGKMGGGKGHHFCWWKKLDKPWNDWGQSAALRELRKKMSPGSAGQDRPEGLLAEVCRTIHKFLDEHPEIYESLKALSAQPKHEARTGPVSTASERK